MRAALAASMLLTLLAACGGPTCGDFQYTRTGPTRPARPAGCYVKVYLTPPSSPYTELGSSDFVDCPSVEYPPVPPSTPDALLAATNDQACLAGGNAIIAVRDSRGYHQAIVVDEPDLCMMPLTPLDPADVPRCTASTYACIDACTTSECANACLDADTTPAGGSVDLDCVQCVEYSNYVCVGRSCPAEWAAYACCYQAHCGGVMDVGTCVDTMCGTEHAAVNACIVGAASTCTYIRAGEPRRCFP